MVELDALGRVLVGGVVTTVKNRGNNRPMSLVSRFTRPKTIFLILLVLTLLPNASAELSEIRLNTENAVKVEIYAPDNIYALENPDKYTTFQPKEEGQHKIKIYYEEQSQELFVDIKTEYLTLPEKIELEEVLEIKIHEYESLNNPEIIIRDGKKQYSKFALSENEKFLAPEVGDYTISLKENGIEIATKKFTVTEKEIVELASNTVGTEEFTYYEKRGVIKSVLQIFTNKDLRTQIDSSQIQNEKKYEAELSLPSPYYAKIKFKDYVQKTDSNIVISKIKPPKNIRERIGTTLALEFQNTEFKNYEVTRTALGTKVYLCDAWNNTECDGNYTKVLDVTPGEEYTLTLSSNAAIVEAGVATVNTHKSVYETYELAEIFMVVLDSQGFLVPNSEVFLEIINPNGISYSFNTTNDSIEEETRGIYKAIFNQTTIEGNYILKVDAYANNTNSSMQSFFKVSNNEPFEIIRNQPYTIDPWSGPYTTTLQVISKTNQTEFDLVETIPLGYNITTAPGAIVEYTEIGIELTWNLTNNSIVSYTVQAPLISPKVDEFRSRIEFEQNVYVEARPFLLAIDPLIDPTQSIDTAITALDNTTFVVAYVDITSDDASFQIISTLNGGTILVSETDVNADVNTDARIDATTINSTHFALNVYDSSGNNNDYLIYDINGTQVMSRVQIDGNAGTQVDTAIEELGDRVVFLWNDPATGDDVHTNVRNHEGTSISGGAVDVDTDANHNEMAVLEDHVDIAALSSTRYVAVWFDDNGDTVRAEIFDETGTSQTAEEVIEATAGGDAQVAATGLRNNYFVVAYYDSLLEDIIFSIYDATGDAFGVVVSQTTIDSAAGGSSRIDVAEVKNDDESYFVITWYDAADDLFEAAVYDSSGNEVTSPFTIESNPDDAYRLISVEGHNSLLDTGLCNGTFAISYTNSSDEATFKQYYVNGSEWAGFCGVDLIDPTIILSTPTDLGTENNQNVTFSFTPYDDQAQFLTCDVLLDGTQILSNLQINNNSATTLTSNIADGTHYWNVTCQDTFGNTNTSETYSFTSDHPTGLVKSTEASDVAITSLSLTKYVVAYTDLTQNHASFQVWDVNGTLIVPETDIDTDIDAQSRIDVEVINSTAFSIGLVDGPEDDYDFWIYNGNGTELVSRTEIDPAILTNTDIKLCQLGNRTVYTYANDADNDADFQIWDNDGILITGETLVDGNIAPSLTLQNLIDCAAINEDIWLYSRFDDGDNDASISIRSATGVSILGNSDLDTDIGETGQIAATGLRNNRTAIAYYDSTDDDITIVVGEYSGSWNIIQAATDIDTDAGTDSRIGIAEITSAGSSNFVVVWQDTTDGDIKGAVYDSNGLEFTPPFTITNNEDATYQLVDVTGYNSLLDTGFCEGTFAIAYVNSSDEITVEGWFETGLPWDGSCTPDTAVPNIQLNSPTGNPLSIFFNQTFDWTATDDRDTNLDCSLVVDNQVLQTEISSLNGSSTSYTTPVGDGNHTWYVNCTDNAGNTNSSAIGTFSIDVDKGNVSITEANDVSITSLDNTTIVIAYIDSGEAMAEFQVWDTNGTLLIPETEIDTTTSATSRISVAAINRTDFSISVIDAVESDVDFYIYNREGNQLAGQTQVDANVAVNHDTNICQLSDRFITAYANDQDNDADFKIWDNTGTQITGETNVNGDINPSDTGQNLIECVAISPTRWGYIYFDDSGGGGTDDVGIAIRSETGANIIGATVIDAVVGETAQVSGVGLQNGDHAIAWYDSADQDITLTIRNLDGTDTITTVLADTDLDLDAGASSKISVAEIISGGNSNVVIAWQDTTDGDIKAAVYDSSGNEVTSPFTLTNDGDATYQLIDLIGYNTIINTGLCEGTFAIAYTNSTGQLTYDTFLQEGFEWDGVCTPDTTLPNITLNQPADLATFYTSNITFNWTADDNLDTNLDCSIIIDGFIIASDISSPATIATTSDQLVGDGNHTWYVNCTDNAGNTNSSAARTFSIDVETGFVDDNDGADVSLAALDNTTAVIGWIDNGNNQASFEIWDLNGTLLVPEVDVVTTVDLQSRVSLVAINTSAFVFGVVDGVLDDTILYYYDRNGTLLAGPVTVEGAVGDNTDVQICELGSHVVATYVDTPELDADFRIYDNGGILLSGEAAVDGNIGPALPLQNLIDCAPISATEWVYAWFDDPANDFTIGVRSETGAQIVGATDIDTDVGETAQIAAAGLRNNYFVLGFYDSTDQDITYTIRELSGASLNTIVANTDIDTDAGADSRISIAEIENTGSSNFVIAWQDTAASSIQAIVIDSNGQTVTPEFTITTEEDATYQLIDVVGFSSNLNFGLCDGTFAIAYVNSSDDVVLQGYEQGGNPWNGLCVPDTTSPIINLSLPSNNSIIYSKNVTFNFTPEDNRDAVLSCDIYVDGIVRASNILSPNGTATNYSILLPDGNYSGYVNCSDDAGNNNVSQTHNFIVDQPTGLVDNNGAADVSILGLQNETIVIAWIDVEDNHASFEVWHTNGTLLVPEVDIDQNADNSSRLSLAPINETSFVIGFVDGQAGNDNLDFFIYDINGTELVGQTQIDGNVGENNDVEVCQFGTQWAVTYANGNDLDNDRQFFDNDGINLVGEGALDGNMGPNVENENLVACGVINDTRVVFARFDDAGATGDDISIVITDESGNVIIPTVDIDTNAGPNGQVAVAPLQNDRFAVAWHDDLSQNVTLSIYDITGDVLTGVVTGEIVDGNIGSTSRVSMSQIDKGINTGSFVITWHDNSTDSIRSAVYDLNGNRLYSPYLVSDTANTLYKNVDVTGTFTHLNVGLCEGTFATVFTNSSNQIEFQTFYEDGGPWDGNCILDISSPNVTLNSPNNNSIFTSNIVTFNWTGYDNVDLNLRCDLYVDGVLRANDVSSPIGEWVNQTLGITNGLHSWNVSCVDNRNNYNSSETRYFTVNSASDFNDVNLPELGDWGIVVYSNVSHQGQTVQRNWTGTLEDAVALAPDFGGNISWQRFTCSKTRPECYVVAQLVDNSINFARLDLITKTYDNNTVIEPNRGHDDQRSFDIACEDNGISEECIIVYETGTGANNNIAYRVWNGSGVEAEQLYSISAAINADFDWVELYPQKDSNLIGVVVQNDAGTRDIHATIWRGDNNTFGNDQTLTIEAPGTNRKQYDCAWEGNSNDLICGFSLAIDDLYAYEYDVATETWNNLGNIYDGLGSQAREVELCGETPFTDDFTHDYLGIMTCDQDADRDGSVWDGTNLQKFASADQPSQDTASECGGAEGNIELFSQSCSFEKSGDEIVFVWVDQNVNYPEYGKYTVSSNQWSFLSWASGAPIGLDGAADVGHVITRSSPGNDEIFLVDQDFAFDSSCAIWTGNAFVNDTCGDFEDTGPSNSQGAYVDFDWIQFGGFPTVEIVVPNEFTTYNFSGINNPSTFIKANGGPTTNLPPNSSESPLFGTEASNSEYTNLDASDGNYYRTTITTTTGDRAYQSFTFEVNQNIEDILSMKLYHEGYATAQTFQNPDVFYFYLYNHTEDNYAMIRTSREHDNDIFTEITITDGFSDFIKDGDVHVLLIGTHTTAGGGDARADIATDYITLNVTAIPSLSGNETVIVHAIDDNGINNCSYYFGFFMNPETQSQEMNETNTGIFENVTDVNVLVETYYNISAYCRDTFNATRSDELLVRIDYTSPVIELESPTDGSILSESNVTLIWNGTDNSNGRLVCNVYLDGSLNTSGIGLDAGNNTNLSLNVTDGYHEWYVTCFDAAGNNATSQTWNFTLDTGPPTITLNTPLNGNVNNQVNKILAYTPYDANTIVSCELLINGIINQTDVTITNGAQNAFTLNGLEDGVYNWSVNCTDDFSYEANSTTWNFTVDTTSPNVTLNVPSEYVFTGGVATLNYTATDNLDVNITCNITINSVIEDALIDSPNGTLVSRNLSLADGFKEWTVTCIDDASNTFTSELRNFTLIGPPFIQLQNPTNNSIVGGSEITFNYSVSDGDGVSECNLYFDGVLNLTNSTTLTNPGTNIFTIYDVEEGNHNWSVSCNDTLGDTGYSDAWQIYVDTTGPNVTNIDPFSGYVSSDSTIYFNITATDNYDTSMTCNMTVDGSVPVSQTNFAIINGSITQRLLTLGNGVHYWNVTCFDDVGNFGISNTWNFTVNQTFPLTVNVTLDKFLYQTGEIINVSINVSNQTGSQVVANVTQDLIFTNTSINTSLPWWNTGWHRRVQLSVAEVTGVERINDQIKINLTGLYPYITTCDNEIRVINFEEGELISIPRIVLSGDDNNTCEVAFEINITSNEVQDNKYAIYFNNSAATAPSESVEHIGLLVQRGMIISSGTTVTDSLATPVNPEKSFIIFSQDTGSSAPDQYQIRTNLTDNSTISFEKYDGSAESNITWQVITHPTDIEVQRGYYAFGATQNSTNITISEVDLASSFIIVHGSTSDGTTGDANMGYFEAYFVNNSAINLHRATTGSTANVTWQVVTWAGATVQRGSFQFITTSDTRTISSFNTSRSFLLQTWAVNGDNSLDTNHLRSRISSSTGITFSRTNDNPSSTVYVSYYLVELPAGYEVQTGSLTLSTPFSDVAINSINLSNAFNFHTVQTSGGGTTYTNGMSISNLTSSTNLRINKETGSNTNIVTWFVIEDTDFGGETVTGSNIHEWVERQTNETNVDGDLLTILNSTIYSPGNYSVVALASNPTDTPGSGADNFQIIYDEFGPEISLINPPNGTTYIPPVDLTLSYTANDLGSNIDNCSLILNGNVNQTNTSIIEGQLSNFTIGDAVEGRYEWTIQCYDSLGNNATASPSWVVLVDSTPPNVTALEPNGTAHSSNDLIFNFTVTDNLDDELLCNVSVDAGSNWALVNATNGTNTSQLISSIADGFHYWNVTCIDDAGFSAVSQTLNFTIDALPVVSLDSPADGYGSNISDIDFGYFLAENNLVNCSLLIDGTINQSKNASNISYQSNEDINYFNVTGFEEGIYSWNVECTDINGFVGIGTQRTIQIDFVAPNVSLYAPEENYTLYSDVVDFVFNATDNVDDILVCDLFINGELNETNFNASNGENTTVNVDDFIAGDYNWTVFCEDSTGFNVTSITRNFTISEAVIITLISPENESADGDGDVEFVFSPQSLGGFESGGFCDLYIDDIYNQTNITITNAAANSFYTFEVAEGIHTWYVNCTDDNLVNGVSDTYTFTVDLNPPSVSLYFPDGEVLDYSNVEFNWTATDNVATILTCDINIDGVIVASGISTPNGTPTQYEVTGIDDGLHNYNVTCFDTGGLNATSATNNFIVQELPGIALNAPANNFRTNITNYNFTYTPTDNSGTLTSCEFILNGTSNTTDVTINHGLINQFEIGTFENGLYTWNVNCTDPNANENTSEIRTVIFDTLGPNIELKNPGEGAFVNNEDINFTFNATDNFASSVTCDLYLDEILNVSLIPATGGIDTIQEIKGLDTGPHNWTVICWDDLQNYATSVLGNFTVNSPDFATTNANLTVNNSNPDVGENLTIYLNVTNIGGATAAPVVEFWDGPIGVGTFIGNSTISLVVNQSALFNTTWIITEGYRGIYAYIDPNQEIFELNESNNNASINISALNAEILSPVNNSLIGTSPFPLNFTSNDYTNTTMNYVVFVNGINQSNGTKNDNESISVNFNAIEGRNEIYVLVNDSLGRIKHSQTIYVYLDTTPPTVTYNTQNITWFNASTFNISFNISDAIDSMIDYNIYVNQIYNKSDNASNNSVVNETFSLEDGIYNITTEAWDDANNTQNYTITIYVDTQNPNVTLIDPDESAEIFVTNITFNYTVTDNLDEELACEMFVDSVLEDSYNLTNGSIRSAWVANILEGDHDWNVTCIDNATNLGISQTRNFSIFVAPDINLTAPQSGYLSNNQTLTFYFNVSDDTGLTNCSLLIDGAIDSTKAGAALTNGAENNFTVTGLSGNHTWAVQCYDNTSREVYGISGTRNFTIDVNDPIPIINTQNETWFNIPPVINFTITDDYSSTIDYRIFVNDTFNVNGTTTNNSWAIDTLIEVPNGTHTIIVEGNDTANNTGNSSQITIYVDTVAPIPTLYYPDEGRNVTNNDVFFNFSISDNLSPNITYYFYIDGILRNSSVENVSTIINQTFTLTSGPHTWFVNGTDLAGNVFTSQTINFSVVPPDLTITSGNITFNNTNPIENSNITIFANISNIGDVLAGTFNVQIWYGDPLGTGSQIGSDFVISSLASGNSTVINTTYIVPIGSNNFYVLVDTPLATNGSIEEENETNNQANNTLIVGLWQFVSGSEVDSLVVTDGVDISVYEWITSNTTGGNIFATDSESSLSFLNLTPITRSVSNSFRFEDLGELDVAIGSNNLTDSINRTYSIAGSLRGTQTFNVFNRSLTNVPTVNSTNNTNFLTGILWDANDGNTTYNGSQDVAFISEISKNTQGYNGTVDFEIRVPALLRDLFTVETTTVYLYTEII